LGGAAQRACRGMPCMTTPASLDPGRVEGDPSMRGPEPEHLTDLGNARRFVRFCGADIRYVPPLKRWLIWDGTRWQPDETQGVLRLAKSAVIALHAEAGYEIDDDKRRRAISKHANASESARSLEAMVRLAQSEATIPVLPAQLDADPWRLNVLNGTLDLRTGTL